MVVGSAEARYRYSFFGSGGFSFIKLSGLALFSESGQARHSGLLNSCHFLLVSCELKFH